MQMLRVSVGLIRISPQKEAPQISEMSDTAVSSLTANGLRFPWSLFVVFFCCDSPGIRSSGPMPWTDAQLLRAAQQKKKLSGSSDAKQTKPNHLCVGSESSHGGWIGTSPNPRRRISDV